MVTECTSFISMQRQVSTFAKLVGQSFEVQCESTMLCFFNLQGLTRFRTGGA